MPESRPRRAECNAGAFMGPFGTMPVPMTTLSDEYHDEPAEPADSERVPAPEPPSRIRRAITWLRRRTTA